MDLVFDIETDDLKATKVWCIVAQDVDTQEIFKYPPDKLDEGVKLLQSANKLIGVKEINAYLKGSISLNQCKELINIKTRQYAKRQNTWARGHMKNWNKLYSKDFSVLLKKTLKVVS